jgi:hypothetical protein
MTLNAPLSTPRFGVVIVAYDAETVLPACLEALFGGAGDGLPCDRGGQRLALTARSRRCATGPPGRRPAEIPGACRRPSYAGP